MSPQYSVMFPPRRRRLINAIMALTALGGGQTYAQYIAGLAPLIWLRFNEISGTTVLNWGTGGSTFDGVWTPGSGAQGQTDALGANEAYNFQSNSVVAVPISGLASTAQAFTELFLVKPTTAGPAGIGMYSLWGAQNTELRFNAALTSLTASVDVNGAPDANSITTTGLTASQNAILAKTWDFNGDKLIRIYKGQGQTLSEYGYSAQSASVGTFLNRVGSIFIGNNGANGRIQNGLIGEYLYWPSIIPTSVFENITKLVNPT